MSVLELLKSTELNQMAALEQTQAAIRKLEKTEVIKPKKSRAHIDAKMTKLRMRQFKNNPSA